MLNTDLTLLEAISRPFTVVSSGVAFPGTLASHSTTGTFTLKVTSVTILVV